MAIALMGKSFYLLPVVLIIFLCVSYGFRIRDVSQVSTVETRECTSADRIGGKCSIDDGQGVLTLSKKRGDKLTVGLKIDKIKVERNLYDDEKIKDYKRDRKSEINLLKKSKIITPTKIQIANDDDDDDGDDDDDDDDVDVDDDDEEEEESKDEIQSNEGEDADDDDDEEEESVEKIESNEKQDDDDEDDDEESDEQDIIIENDDNDDDSEDQTEVKKVVIDKLPETVHEESPKVELDKKKRKLTDDSKLKKPITPTIPPTPVKTLQQNEDVDGEIKEKKLLRKFEKVHLADKDKKKMIEEKIQVNISQKIEKKAEPDSKIKIKKPEEPRVVKEVEKKVTKEAVKNEVKPNVKTKKTTIEKQKVSNKKQLNEPKKTTDKEIKEKTKSSSKNKKPTKKKAVPSISLSDFNNEILQLPNFIPNFTSVENAICQQHGKIFLRQLRGYKLWALQMLDSSGKIPSGLLRGNINQLGDFDECLGVIAHIKMPENTLKIQGKYCLVNIDIQSLETNMKIPLNLMQSRGFVKGTMNDPGHFIPKFTTVNWGLCIPAACTEVDAKNTMENSLNHLSNISGLKFMINVNETNCYVKQKVQNYSKETIGVLYFYAMIFCLVIVATFRDFIITNKDKQNYSERIIMSFSLKKTTKALFKPIDDDSEEITCIHGIRSIATIILYIGHKIISIAGLPYTNREALTEIANHPATSVLRVAVVYTDSFLLISGVLISHSMAKEYSKNGEIRWFCRLIARYIRLTPALLIIIFWYAFIMEHFGSGPQWNSIIKTNADLCKRNAWTNLLYIQNFFPFEEMCATHTHHLAIDMQLSLLAPVLVFFLQTKAIIGIIMIFFLLQVSATLRYFASINNYLSLVIFHGISLKHLYKTANLTYAVSLHRVTPYLFGIGLGVLLHHTGKKLNIYKIFIAIAWIITILLFTWALFWPWNASSRNYVYNAEDAAHYAVIGPVAWALALCWLIFACFTGYGGAINRCLSNYWLVVFSRISYSVYLTQFAVFFYNTASTRYATEFQMYKILDPFETLTVIVISIILTLFFDIPIQEVKNVLMESTKVNKPPPTDEVGSNKNSKDHSKASEQEAEQNWSPRYYEKFENNNDDLDAELNTYEKVKKWEQMTEDYQNREKRRSKSTPRMIDTYLGSRGRETTPSFYDKRDHSSSRVSEPRSFGLSDMSPRHLRKVPINFISSESEDEPLHRKRSPRRPIERPRVSDEEDWEQELRIRRRRFVEKMTSEHDKSDTDEPDLIRRSSAEGKIALLKGPTGSRVMDAWTVSRGPRALLGSSQETDDDFYGGRIDVDYNKEIIQEKTSSISNMGNGNQFNNNNDSISNDNISTIPGKLFKRESIVKSQPSEEDPEYLLPERPKLVEQEQEHPFKKAWQMQKSKSEEDGPSAFAIKEVKVEDIHNPIERMLPSSTESSIQLVIEDVDVTKKDDNQVRAKPLKQQTISIDDDMIVDEDIQSTGEVEKQNDDSIEKEEIEEDTIGMQDS